MKMDEENIEWDVKIDKKQVYIVLGVLFVICLIILVIYSIKVSNDYNKLVIELNELRRNATNCLGGLI